MVNADTGCKEITEADDERLIKECECEEYSQTDMKIFSSSVQVQTENVVFHEGIRICRDFDDGLLESLLHPLEKESLYVVIFDKARKHSAVVKRITPVSMNTYKKRMFVNKSRLICVEHEK